MRWTAFVGGVSMLVAGLSSVAPAQSYRPASGSSYSTGGYTVAIGTIALLRNPIDRALSHYQHEVRGGRESLSFEEALDREPERLAGEEERLRADPGHYSYNHHRYSYLRRGLNLEQLLQWLRHFPRSQLLVLQSEWLFRDPPAASAAVYRFLGLSDHRLKQYKAFYQGSYERTIPASLRTRLQAHFEAPNRELFRWLGEEFDWA